MYFATIAVLLKQLLASRFFDLQNKGRAEVSFTDFQLPFAFSVIIPELMLMLHNCLPKERFFLIPCGSGPGFGPTGSGAGFRGGRSSARLPRPRSGAEPAAGGRRARGTAPG